MDRWPSPLLAAASMAIARCRPAGCRHRQFFFSNPASRVSAQQPVAGRPKRPGNRWRFTVNFTFGVLGFFDPATRIGIPNRSEDFGQTPARWG